MNTLHLSRLASLLTLTFLSSIQAAVPWLESVDAAKPQAAREGKGILVAFTAYWAPPSLNLWNEVLSDDTTATELASTFVLVRIHHASKPSGDDGYGAFSAIMDGFGAQQVPTVLLMTASGVEFARLDEGYNKGDKAAYLKKLWGTLSQGGSGSKGIREDDVLALLSAGSESAEIVSELQRQGYTGKKDADTLKKLRAAGAKPDLLLAVTRAAQSTGGAAKIPDGKTAAPGLSFTNSVGMKMLWTRPDGNVTEGFHLATTELTQGQWRAVMKGTETDKKVSAALERSIEDQKRNSDAPKYVIIGDDYPIVNISHSDAEEFCKRLTELERARGTCPANMAYMLPTDAQWLHAARFEAGKDAESLQGYGWVAENSGRHPHPVATNSVNVLGFFDLIGNVNEHLRGIPMETNYLSGTEYPVITYRGGDFDQSAVPPTGKPRSDSMRGVYLDTLGARIALDKAP